MRRHACFLVMLLWVPLSLHATELRLGQRTEILHHSKGHEAHLSGAAVAVTREDQALVSWVEQQGQSNHLYLARPGRAGDAAVRVNPEGLEVDSLHQAPGLAVGPQGEVYVSWSSSKAKPEGTLFVSDLRLSRSLDEGKHFDSHLRVNEDRPISHSFEGLAVAADGSVLVTWIDSRAGWEKAGTYLARLDQRGTRVETVATLDSGTCVCCRVSVTTGPQAAVAVTWRKVFPDNIRDMVLSLSQDNGRSFAPAVLVHADHWRMAACPHRGGMAGMDGSGRLYLTWYTEGVQEAPRLLFATSSGSPHFTEPKRLDSSTTSIPDHPRMAVDTAGRAVIVWEDSTAVRRRVLLRYTTDGGETLSPTHVLSQAIKAYAPDIALAPTGDFVVVWHEEQFPATKTVVQSLRLDETR